MTPFKPLFIGALAAESTDASLQIAQADPASIASIFELVVQNGLSLSLAILLVWGAFTQRISFDGKEERTRRANRDASIDTQVAGIHNKLDRIIDRSGK